MVDVVVYQRCVLSYRTEAGCVRTLAACASAVKSGRRGSCALQSITRPRLAGRVGEPQGQPPGLATTHGTHRYAVLLESRSWTWGPPSSAIGVANRRKRAPDAWLHAHARPQRGSVRSRHARTSWSMRVPTAVHTDTYAPADMPRGVAAFRRTSNLKKRRKDRARSNARKRSDNAGSLPCRPGLTDREPNIAIETSTWQHNGLFTTLGYYRVSTHQESPMCATRTHVGT